MVICMHLHINFTVYPGTYHYAHKRLIRMGERDGQRLGNYWGIVLAYLRKDLSNVTVAEREPLGNGTKQAQTKWPY